MNGHIAVIFNQITIFGILMFIGFVASKRQLIDETGLSFLAKLIVKLILPCLIFMVVTSSNPTLSDILHSWRFFVAVVFLFTMLAVTGFFMGKLFKLKTAHSLCLLPLPLLVIWDLSVYPLSMRCTKISLLGYPLLFIPLWICHCCGHLECIFAAGIKPPYSLRIL